MEPTDQSTPADGTEPRPSGSASEDVVIVAVIALGFLGSIIIYVLGWPIPALVVSILLSAAVSALVYRFLGGISQDTAFRVGALKLGGVLAALIGCGLLFTKYLPEPHTLDTFFDPPRHEWVAFDKASMMPIDVRVVPIEETIEADHRFTQQKQLYVHKDSLFFTVSPDEMGDFALGTLSAERLKALGFTATLGQFKHTKKLQAGARHNIDSWGLVLKTHNYSNDESKFEIRSTNTGSTATCSLEARQTCTVALDGSFYLVYVLEANHGGSPPWARFGVARVNIDLQ